MTRRKTGKPSQRAAVRRSVFLGAVVALALVTGCALIATAVVLQPPSLTPLATADTEVIRRFYAAVNEGIATGDPALLQAVVTPYFVERAPLPGEASGRSGLETYLTTLHDADPGLRLMPVVVAAAGDLVVVHVAIQRGLEPRPFAGVVVDPPRPWGAVDVLRLADGAIAERWTQTEGTALVRPLAAASVDLRAPTPRILTLARLTLAAGEQWRAHATGPHLLYLEAGQLSVRVREERRGGSEPTSAPPAAQLVVRQALVLPAETAFDLTSLGPEASQVVVVTFDVPHVPGGGVVLDPVPPNVAGQTLAGGMAANVSVGPEVLTLGQVRLASGAELAVASAGDPLLVAVEAGQLDLVASDPAWIRRGADGGGHQAQETRLAPGDGALLGAGGVVMLRNMGAEPVAALFLTLHANPVDAPIASPT